MGIYRDLALPARKDRPPGRPYVLLNMVSTLDGNAVPPAPGYGFFASPQDWEAMVDLRSFADAILNGARTAMQLRPAQFFSEKLLERRRFRGKTEPVKYVVLSSGRSLDPEAPIFSEPERLRPLVFVPAAALGPLRATSLAARAELRAAGEEQLDVTRVLEDLRRESGVEVLLSEGGSHSNASLLRSRAVDELFLTLSPRIYAGPHTASIVEGDLFPPGFVRPQPISAQIRDDLVFLRYRLGYE